MKFRDYLKEELSLDQLDIIRDILIRTFEKQSKLTVFAPNNKNKFHVRFLIPKIEVELGSISIIFYESTQSFSISFPSGCAESEEFKQKILLPVVKQLNMLASSLTKNLKK